MKVRRAVETDIPQLCEIARAFIEESRYGWSYSPEVSCNTWQRYIDADDIAVLVADRRGELLGGAVVAHERDFTAQRIGYVIKFYILPEHRKTRAAFLIAAKMNEWFDHHLCWAAFATSTANIGPSETESYTKLMQRSGFENCGPTLMRKAHG